MLRRTRKAGMQGVYALINKFTGDVYIGQSVDIERRVAEHFTPKAYGNNRLHGDIQKLGKEAFDVILLEEINDREMRLEREHYYINLIDPKYNYVGKPIPSDVKGRISRKVKQNWESMPSEDKLKIINNNLTGPRKGHKVSKETREKLRKANLGKRLWKPCLIVEDDIIFPGIKDVARYIGCTPSAILYAMKENRKVKGKTVVRLSVETNRDECSGVGGKMSYPSKCMAHK